MTLNLKVHVRGWLNLLHQMLMKKLQKSNDLFDGVLIVICNTKI